MTEPTDALDSCPFCGNTNAIVYDDLLTFHVGCLSCGATGSASSYRNGAITAWNRRSQLAVAGEPVAWLSTDCIGERYLCFTKPSDSDPARPLVFGDTTPPPDQAQAGAVPLDEARRLFGAGWKAAARFCDREDVVADGIIGLGACPQFEAAFAAAHGIKGGQHGPS